MLNSKTQSKEETLVNIKSIFGSENQDLLANLKLIIKNSGGSSQQHY
jgi:hypothetical protein